MNASHARSVHWPHYDHQTTALGQTSGSQQTQHSLDLLFHMVQGAGRRRRAFVVILVNLAAGVVTDDDASGTVSMFLLDLRIGVDCVDLPSKSCGEYQTWEPGAQGASLVSVLPEPVADMVGSPPGVNILYGSIGMIVPWNLVERSGVGPCSYCDAKVINIPPKCLAAKAAKLAISAPLLLPLTEKLEPSAPDCHLIQGKVALHPWPLPHLAHDAPA
eukprot:CAMPEP_0178375800 /NCGR_PEP_ID=MMETSP0689_2-20121128/3078_1 /TAXON_ID=160604 /ORGANISM="Amphidinium massartii, Strain CS-259" /LENGTH=216 /DNA_ID=CAMNT_0019995811 /DNA_START=506 /DNA_END=1158 /DNA_ORIENTATION=+